MGQSREAALTTTAENEVVPGASHLGAHVQETTFEQKEREKAPNGEP